MKTTMAIVLTIALSLWAIACGQSGGEESQSPAVASNDADTHTHADGSTHDDHAEDAMGEEDHAHDETSLGAVSIGDMQVELAQGHGAVAPGAEGHLVVKLPYSDDGATIVRAWIGGEDRTLSFVGKGEYAASHDDYDIHAIAPDPLPANTMWWIEVEKPDGTKVVGSATPIMN